MCLLLLLLGITEVCPPNVHRAFALIGTCALKQQAAWCQMPETVSGVDRGGEVEGGVLA